MTKQKLLGVIIGWSVGMIGLTLAGVGAYTFNPALQWIGNSLAAIGIIILTAPFIFKK